jgi:ABC-2 type transport system permease protein
MTTHVRAVVWAQQRAILHGLQRNARAGSILAGLVLLAWYAGWMALAVLAGVLAGRPDGVRFLTTFLPQGLFFATLYWQLTPVLLGSQGASLDVKKLLAFPIPPGHLFALEIVLRTSTCLEMLLLVSGVATGLVVNPALRSGAAPPGLALFVMFNLLVGAGLKYQLERWFARRRLRELLMLLLVMAAALPQLLVTVGAPAPLRASVGVLWMRWWPWSLAASVALGRSTATDWGLGVAWLLLAYWYGRTQFRRNLRLEPGDEVSRPRPARSPVSRLEPIYRLPSRFLPDPLAVVVEKEIRSLVRSPRFRLLFVMGFSFGMLIFLPMLLRSRSGGEIKSYQLTMVCGYALLLLSDVLFWNIFGPDRAAAQLYFLQPLSMLVVVAGKNLAAGVFVLLEITCVVVVWTLLRMPVDAGRIAEAYLAPAVLSVYMMAMGNLASVYYPRPLSPEKTSGAGSAPAVRILLLLLLPVLSLPVLVAYAARYAFRSQIAFFLVLALAALVGAALYRFALATAANKAQQRKERLLETLSAGEGPIQLG